MNSDGFDSVGNVDDQWREDARSHGSDDFDLLKRRKNPVIGGDSTLNRKKKFKQVHTEDEDHESLETEREILIK